MNKSCPISHKVIDGHIVRMVAFQVVVLGSLFLITGEMFFVLVLLFDYIIRVMQIKNISPLLCFANIASQVIGVKPKMCDEAPKRFALHIGLGVISLIAIAQVATYTTISLGLMTMLVTFASMEAFFDYCVGCKIYQYLTLLRI